jgi:hypothetical protein
VKVSEQRKEALEVKETDRESSWGCIQIGKEEQRKCGESNADGHDDRLTFFPIITSLVTE